MYMLPFASIPPVHIWNSLRNYIQNGNFTMHNNHVQEATEDRATTIPGLAGNKTADLGRCESAGASDGPVCGM